MYFLSSGSELKFKVTETEIENFVLFFEGVL